MTLPLQNQTVLVLGLGQSGLAMARWCTRLGARVQVWDSRAQPPQAQALRAELPQAMRLSGSLDVAALQGVQLLLKSPGLSPQDEQIAPLLAAAREAGIRIDGELGLFSQALAELKAERGYAPKVLAVTGTNGKTTTTAMCALMVARCGLRVAAAGNIGPSLLDTLAQALDQEPVAEVVDAVPAARSDEVGIDGRTAPDLDACEATAHAEASDDDSADGADDEARAEVNAFAPRFAPPPAAPVFQALPEVWVLELSSFQLDGVQGFEPTAAAVLNLSQDHLDWHGDMVAYAAAKARVFGQGAVMVVNRDDPATEALVPTPGPVKTGRGRNAAAPWRAVLRFGLDTPQHPGDYGLVEQNGMAWLVRARETDPTIKRRRDEVDEIQLQRLMPADALRVRGRHNAANALAALALAGAAGCPLAPMLHGLREYAGEPHRLQFVASVAGVDAYDDSKGTNVGATVAALQGLGADQAPGRLVVVLGGQGKGQDFSPLAVPLSRFARAVVLIGQDAAALAQALAAALAEAGVALQQQASLEDAVRWGLAQALPGDALLLSPACASLDMFRNYGHRGEAFARAVLAHAADLGEAVL